MHGTCIKVTGVQQAEIYNKYKKHQAKVTENECNHLV